MPIDFGSARLWAQEALCRAVRPGARCVDATLGNGHDCARLCELVGEEGVVYGFDIQPEAVERTRARLEQRGLLSRARLFCAGHETMARLVPGALDAVVFNLGWLPGAPHGITTRADTTLAAVAQAVELLAPGGLLSVCVYPGHEEGRREREALFAWAAALPTCFDVLLCRYLNRPNDPPEWLGVCRKAEPGQPPIAARL